MRSLAVTRSLLAVLVAHVAAEQDSCPGGPASCTARDEETALLQLARAEPFVGGVPKFYCNPHTKAECTNPPCHKVGVNVTDPKTKEWSWKLRCSGEKVNLKYIDAIFGSKVKAIPFPSTYDQNVEKDIFEIPDCGGMEQVRYAKSTTDMLLYSASQYKVNQSNLGPWLKYYTAAKWWVGEKTLSGLPGYKPITTADYANEVVAVPWVPMTAIKCTFAPTHGFYIGSGAPRKTGSTNLKDMCSEYNVGNGGGLWKNFIKQLQDPEDDQLQIFMKSKSGHIHLPDPNTCWVCDVSDTKVPMWDQMSCGSADRKTDPRCKGVKPCTWLQLKSEQGPTTVEDGEECNGSLSPEYATVCKSGSTCYVAQPMPGASGVCVQDASNCKANDHVPCPVSGNMCSGNQCCPGVDASGGKTFPCPSASDPATANCQTSVPISMCVG